MNNYLNKFKLSTRWADIPNLDEGYRLLCNQEDCSLSCANVRNGKLAITSIHGDARHSYTLSKKDMAFLTVAFLNTLSKKELDNFTKIFNKVSPEFVLTNEEL